MASNQTIDDDFWHWFAGFVDGEGCFTLSKRGRSSHTPEFTLALRADDREILEEVARRLGGRIYSVSQVNRRDGVNRNPRVDLRVTKKSAIVRLVQILDDHPLRAKKSRDYAIWRKAVLIWAGRERHRGAKGREAHAMQEELAKLKVELEEGRKFR